MATQLCTRDNSDFCCGGLEKLKEDFNKIIDQVNNLNIIKHDGQMKSKSGDVKNILKQIKIIENFKFRLYRLNCKLEEELQIRMDD